MSRISLLLCVLLALGCAASFAAVEVRQETVVIPTYLAGDPEPNPMFYFGRQSQGAAGKVYPYPLYDTLTHRKVDKSYRMVYLENEYIRIGILPEIGGRIFEGVDKTNGYHFFYRQHVIKPALIGLIGAWISGGVEWNIPHHHRASTFIPVQYSVEEHADGSRTVWVGELEVRHRMRWAVGYTLRPGKAYLEASVRILNRTPVVNTMLCFANVAVHTNENYQVIFPPGTRYGTHHSKREFTTWPLSSGRYGGWDFGSGTDLTWYKNHVSANSIFAWNYEDDFLAGYDHGRRAGLMSVADHHVVPGKKLWTWGSGPRGRMWDKILTDDDGPYIELMVGAYSDNQPDYSWLQPYEVKSFSLNWYPFREIGGVKKANLEAAVNLEVEGGTAKVGFHTTSPYPSAEVSLKAGDRVLLSRTVAIDPARPFVEKVALPAGVGENQLRAALSSRGREVIAYSPAPIENYPAPEPYRPPPPPSDMKTVEELYLAGLRIEQFHAPGQEPDPYWEEALRRDPGDARTNTALGIAHFKRARFADSERLFRKAIERLGANHTTPRDGEPFYYLGLALKAQGQADSAFPQFYKATWSMAWRAPAYFSLAEIAALRGDFEAALDLVQKSLDANALNPRAANLKAALLRHAGRPREALDILDASRSKSDPLDVRSMAERWLASRDASDARLLGAAMNGHPHTASETAAEYLDCGLWQDGMDVLSQAVESADSSKIHPLVFYYLGYFARRSGKSDAAGYYTRAARMPPDYVFPFQWEAIEVLRDAARVNPADARAPYYLGNLLFDWQPEEAVRQWEASAALDPSFAIVQRNLAIALSHRKSGNSPDRAVALLEKAVSLPRKYPLHFLELDYLYEASGADPARRLELFERNQAIVSQRDDALNRQVVLEIAMGKPDAAIRLMTGRRFSVWEGGTLNVADCWMDAHLLRGRRHLAARRYREALADFQTAAVVPDNLPSERIGGRQAEIAFWTGTAYAGLGEKGRAEQEWRKAAVSVERRSRGRRAAEPEQGVQDVYRAMCLRSLGERKRAETILGQVLESAAKAAQQDAVFDPGASVQARQAERDRLAAAWLLTGLGHLGRGETAKAEDALNRAVRASPGHLGARVELLAIRN